MQRVPQATKLLARLLKAESVLLSEAAEALRQALTISFNGRGDIF